MRKNHNNEIKAPKWFMQWNEQIFVPFVQDMCEFKKQTIQRLGELEQRINNIVKFNNLKE